MRKFPVDSLLALAGAALLPPSCILCRGAGQRRPLLDLCRDCESELPRLRDACPRCGQPRLATDGHGPDPLPLVPTSGSSSPCWRCEGQPQPYDRCFAPYGYEFPLTHLLQALKYESALANAQVLGRLLARAVVTATLQHGVHCIVPMPLHPARMIARGYNQSYEIARFTARALELPCRPRALRRLRPTAAQVDLSRAERADNVRGAFHAAAGSVAGLHVALLDDVVTTGSTAREATLALLAAGASAVDVWSMARAVA